MTAFTYRRIEITFPAPVPRIVLNALAETCRIAGIGKVMTLGQAGDDSGRLRYFGYTWARPVECPDSMFHVLHLLVGIACDLWERENHTMVMWPAGHGHKPTKYDQGAPVEFDDECYVIQCYAREDYHGRNPRNPDGPRLRAEAEKDRPPSRKEQQAAGEAEYASWTHGAKGGSDGYQG